MTVARKLIVVNALTLVLIVVTMGFPNDLLRLALGIPFLFFFPGYTLVAALMPRRKPGRTLETLTLSLALSIAVVPLIGLLLNYTPWGIRLETVVDSVACFVFVSSAVACFRLRRYPEQEPVPALERTRLQVFGTGVRDWVLSLTTAALLIGALALLVHFVAAPKGGEEFTAFYIVTQGDASPGNTPELKVGQQGSVTVGIANHERRTVRYRIEVLVGGQKNGEVGPIFLTPEEEWQGKVTFLPTLAQRQKVELFLYRNEETTPYLKPLYIWINVGG